MRLIIDNNLWVSFTIGKRLRALNQLFNRPDTAIYVCDELFSEFINVTQRPKFRGVITHHDIAVALRFMREMCVYVKIEGTVSSPVRDKKDIYLLSLAETVKADYIVTGDRDLLVLGHHGTTQIITFADFSSFL